MGILRDNHRAEKRYECEEVVLYEPDQVQIQELKNIIMDNTKIDVETGNAETVYSENIIRYIFKFYTTIGEEIDELTSDELDDLMDEESIIYTHKIKGLVRAIKEMLREIAEQTLYEALEAIRDLNMQLKTVKLQQETNEVEKTFNEISEKSGANVKFEDVVKVAKEKVELEKEIKKEDK